MTILNACTKNVWKPIEVTTYFKKVHGLKGRSMMSHTSDTVEKVRITVDEDLSDPYHYFRRSPL